LSRRQQDGNQIHGKYCIEVQAAIIIFLQTRQPECRSCPLANTGAKHNYLATARENVPHPII